MKSWLNDEKKFIRMNVRYKTIEKRKRRQKCGERLIKIKIKIKMFYLNEGDGSGEIFVDKL